MRRIARRAFSGALVAVLFFTLLHAASAATPAPATLRYHFKLGTTFTLAFTQTLKGTLDVGYPLPTSERVTGLEQGTIQQVRADGSAIFRFTFADLADNYSGVATHVPAGSYSITQEIDVDGSLGLEQEHGSVPSINGHAVDLSPILPVQYARGAVTTGAVWTIPYSGPAMPSFQALTSAIVRFTSLAAGIGTFHESDSARFSNTENDQVLTGTVVLSQTVRQSVVTGAVLAYDQTLQLHARVAEAGSRGSGRDAVAIAETLTYGLDATRVPNSAFPHGGSPVPLATATAGRTPVPPTAAPSPTAPGASPSPTPSPALMPGQRPIVQVTLDVAGLAFVPQVATGYIRFTAGNSGSALAGFSLALLAPGVSTDQAATAVEQAQGNLAGLSNLYTFVGGIADLAPHTKTAMTFDLVPGTYQMLGGPNDRQLFFFQVLPDTSPQAPPAADAAVTLEATTLTGLPAQFHTGAIAFKITNGDTVPHRTEVLQLQPGKTMRDVQSALAAGQFAPGAGYTEAFAVGLLSPGHTVWPDPTLAPGSYLVIYPPDTGTPGAVVGSFTVTP